MIQGIESFLYIDKTTIIIDSVTAVIASMQDISGLWRGIHARHFILRAIFIIRNTFSTILVSRRKRIQFNL